MNIGVVTTSYPRYPGDPAGSFVAAHVAALRKLGHSVDVVAASADDLLFYRGGAPDQIERAPIASLLDAARFLPRFVREIRRGARDWDAIVAHWLVPSAVAALPTGLPLLAIAHGGDVHLLRRYHLLAPVLRLLHARGARIAYVAAELADDHPDSFVRSMGIDVAHFAALPRAPTTPPTIAILARHVPIKGIDVALAALALIDRPVQLAIAGTGPLRYATHDPRVAFVGELDGAGRDALLSRASIVAIPSRALPSGRTEGTPLVALEALAAGVSVVASRVGGLAALAGPVFVAPDDPTALAAALVATLDRPPPIVDMRAHDWDSVGAMLVPSLRTA